MTVTNTETVCDGDCDTETVCDVDCDTEAVCDGDSDTEAVCDGGWVTTQSLLRRLSGSSLIPRVTQISKFMAVFMLGSQLLLGDLTVPTHVGILLF